MEAVETRDAAIVSLMCDSVLRVAVVTHAVDHELKTCMAICIYGKYIPGQPFVRHHCSSSATKH